MSLPLSTHPPIRNVENPERERVRVHTPYMYARGLIRRWPVMHGRRSAAAAGRLTARQMRAAKIRRPRNVTTTAAAASAMGGKLFPGV